MCPADFFGIEYEINPWMRMSNSSDSRQAQKQWQNLKKTLEEEVGAKIELMDTVKELPHLVFTANAGVLDDGKAVPSHFRHPNDSKRNTISPNGSPHKATKS